MARKIVITSGKGGVGKTTVAANLGMNLSLLGARVALIDVDFGLNNLDVVMGIENRVVYDISDVLEGRCRVKQALVQDNGHKNLYVLPSDGMKTSTSLTGQNLKVVTESLAPLFDYLLLDCPAGVDAGFHRAVASAEEAIVVTTPHVSSLRDADKVISVLKSYRLKSVELVVNMVRGDMIVDGEILSPREIAEARKTRLLGVVPQDDGVFLGERAGSAQKAFRLLAGNVMKGTRRIYNAAGRYGGFFGSIRRSLKKNL